MIKYISTILTFILLGLSSYAQKDISFEDMSVFHSKMERFYGKESYSLKVIYRSFKGHSSSHPEDEMTGFISKKGNIFESYQLGVYSIQNENIKVIVDSAEMTINLTYPDSNITSFYSKEQFEESKYNLSSIEHYKRSQSDIIIMTYKYGYSYSKIELSIAKKGFINEMILYLTNTVKYKDENNNIKEEKAKISINYLDISSQSNGLKLNMEDIVIKTKGGYELTSKYKGYELIDYRYQN